MMQYRVCVWVWDVYVEVSFYLGNVRNPELGWIDFHVADGVGSPGCAVLYAGIQVLQDVSMSGFYRC